MEKFPESHNIWDKVFKNGTGKICGRQHLKNLKEYGHYHFKLFQGCLPQILDFAWSILEYFVPYKGMRYAKNK